VDLYPNANIFTPLVAYSPSIAPDAISYNPSSPSIYAQASLSYPNDGKYHPVPPKAAISTPHYPNDGQYHRYPLDDDFTTPQQEPEGEKPAETSIDKTSSNAGATENVQKKQQERLERIWAILNSAL